MIVLNARAASSAEAEIVNAAAALADSTDLEANPGPHSLGVFAESEAGTRAPGVDLKPGGPDYDL